MNTLKPRLIAVLRWTERYTKTDMVYLASNGSWLVAGQIASAAIAFLLAVAFGHYAAPDLYGNYKYVIAMAGLLAALSLSGLPTAITHAVARGKEGTLKQGVQLSLKYSLPLAFIAFCIAVFEYWFSHNLFLSLSFAFIGTITPFLNAFSLFDSFLVGRKDFKRATIYGTLDLLIPTILLVGALFLTKRAIIIVAIYFIANTLVAAWFYTRTKKLTRNSEVDPTLLSYGTHLSVMNIIGIIGDRIDSIAVFYFLGPIPLALYSFAIAMPEQLKGIAKLVGPLALPRFTERSWSEIRQTMFSRIALFSLFLGIGVGLYILLAPLIFHIFFPLYIGAVQYSRVYALSILFVGMITPIISAFQAHQKTRQLYLATNTGSFVLIILTPVLTAFFGIAGAIGSQMAYRATSALFALWQFTATKE